MASSKPTPIVATEKDLTKCGICGETITEPKALPCLHTFCLDCLREWAKSAKGGTVVCPTPTCKKEVKLPAKGVEDLPGNFFVSTLMDRSVPETSKNHPCHCCGEMTDVSARCTECSGFICQKCVDSHKVMLPLKGHQIILLEDLKSGKADLRGLIKRPTCEKHKGQQLWFWCETCGVLICRECTVIYHRSPDHKYDELERAITNQRKTIQNLVDESHMMYNTVAAEITSATECETNLRASRNKAMKNIDDAIDGLKKQVDKAIALKKEGLVKELTKIVKKSEEEIKTTKDALESQETRLRTTREMATDVLQSGSDFDIASMYTQLTSSLQDVCNIKHVRLESRLDQVKFERTESIPVTLPRIGKVCSAGPERVSRGVWVLDKQFGSDGHGKLIQPWGISVSPKSGNIAVASQSEKTHVNIFNNGGIFQLSLDARSVNAYNLVISYEDKIYVTSYDNDNAKYVFVFGPNGRYISQYAAVPPIGISSDPEDTVLRGLAINDQNQVLVGEERNKYISIHDLKGNHIKSVNVNVAPRYITTTREGHIIVSQNNAMGVCILDSTGKSLLTIKAPQHVTSWAPSGVCTSLANEICVANYSKGGIYCYTSTGEYLRCIINDVINPRGIALMEKDAKMLVLKQTCVKIYKRKL